LGVCNGFQILCESGLLPGVLARNARLKFICKDVALKVETNFSAFTNKYAKDQVVHYPVAHGEGNYVADSETLTRIEGNGQVLFRYVQDINGASNAIAGVMNEKGNVAGLMPHPENHVDPLVGKTDGLGLFESMMAA
jgi:phosphoribosylformylglycinamidine synthase subunit PurQ / glutaminase